MRSDRISYAGLLLYGGISLCVVAGSVLVAVRFWPVRAPQRAPVSVSALPAARSAAGEPPATRFTATGPDHDRDGHESSGPDEAVPSPSEIAAALVQRYATVALRAGTDVEEELERLAAELVALGEVAVPALVTRLDAPSSGAAPNRDRLLNVLRRLPGKAAEDRLIREARTGSAVSSRALAIESLGERRTPRALDALSRIALTDADLPTRTLITSPRDPNDTSTELPDEVVYTPRMLAMSALASTRDQRASDVLTGVLRDGPDEALRMYAARHLDDLRDAPGTVDALLAAAAGDASPYVRLAALHALEGSPDRALGATLEKIAARDADAGVRALARQLLASIGP